MINADDRIVHTVLRVRLNVTSRMTKQRRTCDRRKLNNKKNEMHHKKYIYFIEKKLGRRLANFKGARNIQVALQ